MKTCTATLKFISPYSQGKFHETEKLNKEGHAEYEERTWKEKAHWDKDGKMKIPAMSIKLSLEEAAKRLGMKPPGKSAKSTYTKFFKSGILIGKDPRLQMTRDDIEQEKCFIPSSSAGNNRVIKYFPITNDMPAFTVDFAIIDDIITKDAFEEHLEYAGYYVGLGRFRIGNGGTYGRFIIDSISWEEE